MEYLQRGLMSHGLDPGGVKPLDASVPRASGEVAIQMSSFTAGF